MGIRIPLSLVGQLTVGFVVAVWVGARVACLIPETPLRWGFFLLLVLMAIRTFVQEIPAEVRVPGGPLDLSGTWGWGLAIGMAGGLASGLMGIGGGLIMVPLMARQLKLTQHEAQAASLTVMLAPIGLPGVWVYAHNGVGILWLPMAGVAVGFMAGAYGGAQVASRLTGPRLRQGFAILMGIMAALLVVRDF
jgi:uncharacterized membrane protein YfcA